MSFSHFYRSKIFCFLHTDHLDHSSKIGDPNEQLVADFKALKKDPTQVQTDRVLSMSCAPGISRNGNRTMRVEWVTPYRQFATWFMPDGTGIVQLRWQAFRHVTSDGKIAPLTVTYAKSAETGFFEIKAYNKPADEEPNAKPEPEWNPFEEVDQHAAQ